MKNHVKSSKCSIAIFVILLFMNVYAQQAFEGWALKTTHNDVITTMEVENPSTTLNIEKSMIFSLDDYENPISGEIVFTNGVKRDMKRQELIFNWEVNGGQHTVWSYLNLKKKVIEVSPQKEAIPDSFMGKVVRVVVKSNAEYFGTLRAASGNPDAYLLSIDGACCGPMSIDKRELKLLQKINF